MEGKFIPIRGLNARMDINASIQLHHFARAPLLATWDPRLDLRAQSILLSRRP